MEPDMFDRSAPHSRDAVFCRGSLSISRKADESDSQKAYKNKRKERKISLRRGRREATIAPAEEPRPIKG